MKIGIAKERPYYFEGTPDLGKYIYVRLLDETIYVRECLVEQNNVRLGLMEIREGDSIWYTPEEVSAFNSGEKLIGASYLIVNDKVIIDKSTEETCEKNNYLGMIIAISMLAVVLIIKSVLKHWWSKIPD